MSIVRTGWLADLKPAIGMVHLRPLPGSPACEDSLPAIVSAALRDAEAIVEEGMDGLLIENFGDAPFYPAEVPPITIASMTSVAAELRRRFDLPIGINVSAERCAKCFSCGVGYRGELYTRQHSLRRPGDRSRDRARGGSLADARSTGIGRG